MGALSLEGTVADTTAICLWNVPFYCAYLLIRDCEIR